MTGKTTIEFFSSTRESNTNTESSKPNKSSNSNESNESKKPETSRPACLTILGSTLVFYASFGLMSSFGFFQDFYSHDFLRGRPNASIAFIGTLQMALTNLMAAVSGALCDRYGVKVSSVQFSSVQFSPIHKKRASGLLSFLFFFLSLHKSLFQYQETQTVQN